MNKKILILSATNTISGAEIVLKSYIEDNYDFDFYIYSSSKASVESFYSNIGDFKEVITDKHMTNYLLRENPTRIFRYFYSLYKTYSKSKKIIEKEGIGLVYGNNSNDLGLLVLLKLKYKGRIRVISHIHNDLSIKSVGGLYVKLFGRLMDSYIVPSKHTKATLNAILNDQEKIHVAYNGVSCDHNTLRGLEKNLSFAFVGSICRRKRPDLYLDIIKEIDNLGTRYEAYILGSLEDEDLYDKMCDYIEGNSLNVIVKDPIKHEKMQDFYSGIDCLILTSDSDPLPTVLLEAMKSGVLVCARDVGGVREIIDHKINGIIFDYNFNSREVAEAIMKLIDDKDSLNMHLIEAQKKVRQIFTVDKKKEVVNTLIFGLLDELNI